MIKVGVISFYLLIACIIGAVIAIGNGADPIAPIRQLADKRLSPTLNPPKQLANKRLDAILKWKVELGEEIDGSLAEVEGVVYATAENDIYALDATTGEQKWEKTLSYHSTSSPAVANGLVYVGVTSDHNLDTRTSIVIAYALDAQTGRITWQHELSHDRSDYASQPVVADGLVYFSTGWGDYSCCEFRGSGGHISALDAKTGQLVWQVEAKSDNGLGGEPTSGLKVANGMLYSGFEYIGSGVTAKEIQALDGKTGKEVWKVPSDASYPFVATDGTLYLDLDQELLCLDGKTGQEKWRWKLDPAKESLSEPAIVVDTVYVVGNEKRDFCFDTPCPPPNNHTDTLYALDRMTGDEKWKRDIDGGQYSTRNMTFFQGYLYYDVADYTGDTHRYYLEAIDRNDGQFKGRFEVDDSIFASPITSGSTMYLGTFKGTVYALELPN